ncbi:iron uptake porin [Anabaena sp. AL09]|jgi:hypothetical protein|uniref:iron uptake porin n=1 Tax=Anabaena sp. AL09 TaxID=1710891 RepID=UPI0008011E69|nr:iron uptake porin [Anabaena sp. AL09]OBQ09000.1 MAG: hypothetical protein AN490_09770 [Anabaena sp. AL09]
MQKFWTYLITSSSVISSILCMTSGAWAETLPTNNSEQQVNNSQEQAVSQVTSVSQLSDVQPGDWAFQALQSLVERYGCIAGYPNGTFRGNRALSRYEFAAGLNACLDRVNELIATATADLTTKQDLATIQKLQEQFSTELVTLRGRVDTVEAKTAELEANQFSTTTKLQGQVVAVVSDVLTNKKVNGADIPGKNTTLAARTRLEFVSSFTGKDTLLARLESNNINSPNINTPEGNLFFASSNPSNNFSIATLSYTFPVSKNTQVKLIATGGAADDVTSTVNLFDGDGAFGAVSTFGTRNPIYGQLGDKGIAVNHQFGDKIALSLGYLSSTANDPTPGKGLFDGNYGALAQLTVKPSDRISLGLTYINSYNQPLLTGSNKATLKPLDTNLDGILDVPFSSNSYGVQASLGISKKFVLGGWAGYTNSQVLTGTKGEVDTFNYAVTLGFPDLGKKGNLAGVIVGMEPKVTSSNVVGVTKDPNTSYHIEGFYQYKLSDNITLTPAVIWLTAPDHNDNNDNVVIGALRTTFSF